MTKPTVGMLLAVIDDDGGNESSPRYEINAVYEHGCREHQESAKGRGCVHYKQGGWDDLESLWGDYQHVGWAPGYGPAPEAREEARDWSRWLPPGPLPDTGKKELRDGQVWAYHSPSRCAGVVRIENGVGVSLASFTGSVDKAPGIAVMGRDGGHSNVAVLVADVGCEPTPPEALYATPSPAPAVTSGAPAATPEARCPRCNGVHIAGNQCPPGWFGSTPSAPKPRDLTALQPLATFSLPGTNAPQRIAYATRSVKP